MGKLDLAQVPIAKTGMLIRPIGDVFAVIEWDGYSGRTTVEWKFASQKDGATFVSITESGWTGDGDELDPDQ